MLSFPIIRVVPIMSQLQRCRGFRVCGDLEFMTVLMSVDNAVIYTGELAKIILATPPPFVLHHHEILLSGFHQARRRDLWFSHRIR